MDFWARLIGSAYTPKKPATRAISNDPSTRLARFKRVYHNVIELCNRPRNLAAERPLLESLRNAIERVATLLREETRAPVPHSCLQFARGGQIYTAIARAATVSQYEPVIRSAVAVFAALVDSEEEDFLASEHFSKSLMRLVRKVLESGNVLVDTETETAILELLFTIAAKIRLQPEILPVWFQSTAKSEMEDVFIKEKKSFVGITQKDDFPLCYLMIDRVHHEGRIGDFARTGLLYVFEATGRSTELEEWVVSSDLPTLMASGLGALYSQLSRELSILHPDATLPPVLAMSDYTTTHIRAAAESAFSDKYRSHMVTFLSYLAFWQDVLDHCRSGNVKQTLLDHFQILFLQQLLYPSLLQSSDTDAGSSIAVLTYMTSMLEALEYPELVNMMLTYLLAIQDQQQQRLAAVSALELTPMKTSAAPRSPSTIKRRQSLILLNAPQDPDDVVDPILFNLVDLIVNNINSRNSQSAYAALRLSSTILTRHKKYAFGTLLKVQKSTSPNCNRTLGALQKEVDEYSELATSLHQHSRLDDAYQSLCEDVRYVIEAQVPFQSPTTTPQERAPNLDIGIYMLPDEDPLMRSLRNLFRHFLTNSVEVNLALTQMFVSMAHCAEVRLDNWLALSPSLYHFADEASDTARSWQKHLDSEEHSAWSALAQTARQPMWSSEHAPVLHRELSAIFSEVEMVRLKVSNLDQLIAARKKLLQTGNIDAAGSELPSMANSPVHSTAYLEVPQANSGLARSSSRSSQANDDGKATNTSVPQSRPTSVAPRSPSTQGMKSDQLSPSRIISSLFQPPPPETPSTTDVLMQTIEFSATDAGADRVASDSGMRIASLNHILTNIVVLQEFILEIVALLQVRAAVLGEREVRSV